MQMSNPAEKKPHAVLIPYSVQGHINPLFGLAKLLHHRGFHITFVHTEYNYKRLFNSRGLKAFDGSPDFHFETIPDGLPLTDEVVNVTQDLAPLSKSVRENFLLPFRELLARLHDSAIAGHIPPVTGLVSDYSLTFTTQAAQEITLPILLFSTASASSLLSILQIRILSDKGLISLKDRIPTMKNFRPNHFIRTTDPNNFIVKSIIDMADSVLKAPTTVINTYEELETEAFKALSSMLPSVCPIGPFPSFLNQSPQNHLESLASNLWKEDTECLEWLKSKEPNSVVYVNFGSITVMSPEKLLEFAWGLANSKRPFLWIIRPDLVIGGSVILSSEFVNEISDRSLIASWCSQEQVLNHPSIGGFLTHCGWNSTIESICAGVPMVCWPFFADQPTNCRNICNE
ncbi:hypothetical protein PHAVU_004G043100 [Phaseolus vulgaris]|uniref:Glycosyltransferase n=1 Tax=Phaseolus vulgaris TaxID=3885 RepID=V7C3B2_PHAVU|nr:hypothetical protein PHAVU_004G043100g [Phaseolus vulgaris]ESW23391.1 hypothetical protein PHAVU_004G043100g [Phaseolus vulgaris]